MCDVRLSSEKSGSRSGERISNRGEKGRVEQVPVSAPSTIAHGPSNLRASSEKSKKRKMSRSPVKLPRRFEVAKPSESPRKKTLVEDSSFIAALDHQQSHGESRRSGRNRKAAAVSHGGLP